LSDNAAPAATKNTEADGIWQVSRSIAWPDAGGRQLNGFDTFVFQEGTVTLRLLTLHSGTPKTEDDFYRLAARWEGDLLTYRPPFGEFQPLADFEDGRFVDIGNGVKRVFDRILPSQIHPWNRAMLSPRALHVYGNTP
jgi:hypothetical protein